MQAAQTDTIAAIATPPGQGGVAIVRISGPLASTIGKKLTGQTLKPRYAHYLPFKDHNGQIIDQGIALFFKAPNSFTGEDVLELQGHGGPVVMDMMLEATLHCGARLAKPGEFSERAFLNDKLDLAQAEAIADLIESGSREAARGALRSLSGEFSEQVNRLVEAITHLRMYVEAAIDFPDEEIDFLADDKVATQLEQILAQTQQLRAACRQGSLLREGINVVIAGKPNAGKSSLLNALAGRDAAIVTDIEGTTRDVVKEQIQIDGLPLHIIDTAGLRQASDKVEQIGIERAAREIESADVILLVKDGREEEAEDFRTGLRQYVGEIELPPITLIRNKCDLTGEAAALQKQSQGVVITLSAATGEGLELLRQHLKDTVGYSSADGGVFVARRRHLDAIERAIQHLHDGQFQLKEMAAGELLAEELKLAQNALSEITGEFTADDLLGEIFSSFCIGK